MCLLQNRISISVMINLPVLTPGGLNTAVYSPVQVSHMYAQGVL